VAAFPITDGVGAGTCAGRGVTRSIGGLPRDRKMNARAERRKLRRFGGFDGGSFIPFPPPM
jgi:hypothetical protein